MGGSRSRTVAAGAVAGLGTTLALGALAPPAGAATTLRSAWWNEAPLGLVLAPSGVRPGELAVGRAGSPTAVAAVAYGLDAGAAGGQVDLTLSLDPSSSVGSPDVTACPVQPSAAGWKDGGGQAGPPPAYDCSGGGAVTGQVSADGTSVVFPLTAADAEPGAPGTYNLAIVPTPGSSSAFQAVFQAPKPSDFALAPAAPGPTDIGSGAPAAPGSQAPAPATGPGSTPGPAAGAPPAGSGSGVPLAGTTFGSGPVAALPAPLAPSAAAGPGGGTAGSGSGGRPPSSGAGTKPVLATTPGGWMGGRRQKLLGVWLMVDAGLALVIFGGRPVRAPRLLGPLASYRGAEAADGPGPGDAGTAGAVPGAQEGPVRGIGRFARPRTGAPNRL